MNCVAQRIKHHEPFGSRIVVVVWRLVLAANPNIPDWGEDLHINTCTARLMEIGIHCCRPTMRKRRTLDRHHTDHTGHTVKLSIAQESGGGVVEDMQESCPELQ